MPDREFERQERELIESAPTERELRMEFDTDEELDDLGDCADDAGPYDADEARDAYYGDLGIRS